MTILLSCLVVIVFPLCERWRTIRVITVVFLIHGNSYIYATGGDTLYTLYIKQFLILKKEIMQLI